jgi:hypothetical protein
MSSKINPVVDVAFPVAGADNNSQGFRNNFYNIQAALVTAKDEISELQKNAVLRAQISTINAEADNDLLGSTLRNGLYSQFNGTVYPTGAIDSVHPGINLSDGPAQHFSVSRSATLQLVGWLPGYSCIRLFLVNSDATANTITFATTIGVINYNENFPFVDPDYKITLGGASYSKYKIIEAFSMDSGANIFMSYIGTF